MKQVFSEDVLEVALWNSEVSTISKLIQFKKCPISVFDCNLQARYLLTPWTEGMTRVLKLLTSAGSRIFRFAMLYGSVPTLRNNLHESRMCNPICFKPKKLALGYLGLNDKEHGM